MLSEDQNKKMQDIVRAFHKEASVWQAEYDEYDKGYRILGGDLYTQEQKTYFEARRRPTNVFNLIFPIFNAVLGDFILAPFRERVYAMAGGTPQVAKTLEKLFEAIAQQTDYKSEMSETLMAGMVKRGFVYPRFTDELQLDGSIVIGNIDEYEIMFDSRAKDYYLKDATYMIRSRWMTRDELISAWPEKKKEFKEIIKNREDSAYYASLDDEEAYSRMHHRNFSDELAGKYRVIEFHERILERTEIVFDPVANTTHPFTLKGKRRDLYFQTHPNAQIIERDDVVIRITDIAPGLNMFLGSRKADIQDRFFDIIPYSPYNYAKKVLQNFGLMQNTLGPLQDYNDQRNQILNILNKSATTGETIQPNAFENWNHIKNHTHETGLQKILKAGYEGKIDDVYRRDDSPKFPYANDQYQAEAQQLIQRISGVSDNYFGETQTSNENATLFAQRVKQMQKVLAVMDFNFRRTQNMVWNRVLRLIQANYTSQRVFNMANTQTGDTEEIIINQRIGEQIINDVTLGEYRVFPSNEERDTTLRALKFLEKTEVASMIAQWYGGDAVNARWWLKNADFEDMDEQIQAIESKLQAVQSASQKQDAMGDIQSLLSTAKMKSDLQRGAIEENPTAERLSNEYETANSPA